jgi:hypothetical protein
MALSSSRGGILGALSLLRLNPIGLLPVLMPISALALRKQVQIGGVRL